MTTTAEAIRRIRHYLDKPLPLGETPMRDALEQVLAAVEEADVVIGPFARFFQSDNHDLSPAEDNTIVAVFQDQDTKLPLAELWLCDLRAAAEWKRKHGRRER